MPREIDGFLRAPPRRPAAEARFPRDRDGRPPLRPPWPRAPRPADGDVQRDLPAPVPSRAREAAGAAAEGAEGGGKGRTDEGGRLERKERRAESGRRRRRRTASRAVADASRSGEASSCDSCSPLSSLCPPPSTPNLRHEAPETRGPDDGRRTARTRSLKELKKRLKDPLQLRFILGGALAPAWYAGVYMPASAGIEEADRTRSAASAHAAVAREIQGLRAEMAKFRTACPGDRPQRVGRVRPRRAPRPARPAAQARAQGVRKHGPSRS